MRTERTNGELFMAVRAVIETGIHAKKWTREEAGSFYKSAMPWAPEARRAAELDAATSGPGRRLAYLVGRQHLSALRSRSERDLGSAFDVRGFHDEVLRNGPLPLDVLHEQISGWVADQKRAAGH